VNDAVNLLEEVGVAQHMSDLEQASVFFGSLNQRDAVLQAVGHWFFEEDIIAQFEGFQGWFGVELVLGSDNGHIGEFRIPEGILPGVKLTLRWNAVALSESGSPGFEGFGDGCDPKLILIGLDPLAIYICASVSGADQED
jgi:hypothetical protein